MYFQGTKVVCPNQKCNKPVDWWDAILNAIKTDFFIATVLAPIGARSTFFTVNLALGELLTIKFDEHGLPKDAKILEVNYTPQGGGLFPLEMHGNTPHRHIISSQVTLYPIPFSKNCPPDDTKVGIFVTWVPKTMDDEAWQNLAESFEAFSQNRYSSSIIPANVSVEAKLAKLLSTYLQDFASKKQVEDFLDNGAGYSHQLNVVLPMIVAHLDLPVLPNNIRGMLNRLRGLRNELAHDGKTKNPLNKNETAELLVAALFGFHYLTLVNNKVIAARPASTASKTATHPPP